jgi:probable HAF family extracellular repeat protein
MKWNRLSLALTALILWFAGTTVSSAQQTLLGNKVKHQRYKLVDLGTLGGPVSYESVDGEGNQILNNAGVIAFSADTSIPDPNAPDFCFNPHPDGCFVTHATKWKDGTLTDLGALPGLNSSAAGAINDRGWSVGQSQNGSFDALTGIPVTRAVFWRGEQIRDLGTLGGVFSLATGITDDAEVVGMATIDQTPDPFGPLSPWPSPTHPFIWKQDKMIDLGTLGGPDAFIGSGCVNQGLAVGGSLTSSIPDPATGFPPMRPFAWGSGKMIDLGTLGGNFGFAQCGNDRGQVIGTSSLAEHPFACFTGEPGCHPFLWERGTLKDLGTLGGDNGIPIWINDAGDIVGEADVTDNQARHAFLWRKGIMTDLGSLGDDSHATAINSKGQVVGWFFISGRTKPPFRHAFIWENDGSMVDLNMLIPSNSGLELVAADNVNERGEIVGVGVPAGCFPDFCGHLFLLIPCGVDEGQDCADNEQNTSDVVQSGVQPMTLNSASTEDHQPKSRASAWRMQMANRYDPHTVGMPRK